MSINRIVVHMVLIAALIAGANFNAHSDQTASIPLLSLENTHWTDEEIAYIRALHRKGSIEVATKINYAVYLPQKDKPVAGFHYGILKEFADLAQIDIAIQLVEWKDYFHKTDGDLAKIKSDTNYAYTPTLIENVDFYLDGFTSLPWRKKMFDIIEFVPSRRMLVVRKNDNLDHIKELDGKVSALVRGTSMEQNLRQIGISNKISFEYIYTNNFEDMEKLVSSGQADFTVFDSDRAFATLKRYDNLRIAWPISEIQKMGWAIDKRNKVLKNILIKYLKYAQESAILDKHWRVSYGVSFLEYLKIMNFGRHPN